MALNYKIAIFLLITLPCLANASSRKVQMEPGFDLARRLEESGGVMECWNALMELKSCSNEIIIFFLNGQADIGPGCCKAINVITGHCWSSMLTSLGFTVEEGNILVGYCDASSSGGAPVASPPIAPRVAVSS